MENEDPFEQPYPEARHQAQELVLELDGFAGPIDLLLTLAREQKVDLTKISILHLAEQYLAFVQQARRVRLELAADYLVMAAWLAYLKSRLLLPAQEQDGDEPSGQEMAAALQFQLRRLEAMREAGARLLARPRLGRDVFARGAPEGIRVVARPVYDASLFELLSAYAGIHRRGKATPLTIEPSNLFSADDALQRLRAMLGTAPEWTTLMSFLPSDLADDGSLVRRSAVAATVVAGLELAKSGAAQLRQDGPFGPIYIRRNTRRPQEAVRPERTSEE